MSSLFAAAGRADSEVGSVFDEPVHGVYWRVPAGVTSVKLDVFGGQGWSFQNGPQGGKGAHIGGRLGGGPGERLNVGVGQMGGSQPQQSDHPSIGYENPFSNPAIAAD